MADTLEDLAARCESAAGPDRGIDYKLACWFNHRANIPHYTASLDAAMTLVPEGWETAIYVGGENANVQMETQAMRDSFFADGIIDATAATPALALCAAVLRARASQENSRG